MTRVVGTTEDIMSERSTRHATFVIERTYAASPARVFEAWADPEAKRRWFVGPDEWVKAGHDLDYDMHLDATRISVSLATVEFKPAGAGTRLIFTEQAVFLDGFDDPAQREAGTRTLLDNLDAELRRQPAGA